MKVRPAQAMTTAWTAPSAAACFKPSCRPCRTCRLNALTGGLLAVRTATRPRRSRSTDSVIFVMAFLERGEEVFALCQTRQVLGDEIGADAGDVGFGETTRHGAGHRAVTDHVAVDGAHGADAEA